MIGVGLLAALLYFFVYVFMIRRLKEKPRWIIDWNEVEALERQEVLELIYEELTEEYWSRMNILRHSPMGCRR